MGMSGFGLAGAGASLLTGITNGIFGDAAHHKYARTLSGINLSMPEAIDRSESIYSDIAGHGLADKNTILNDMLASEAGTITRAKTVADSPDALLNAITNLNAGTQSSIRGIDIQDSQLKDAHSQLLAKFLGTVRAPAENRINDFEANKKIQIAKEKMMGTQELLSGIEGGIGSALSAYGSGAKTDYLNTKNDALQKFWGI